MKEITPEEARAIYDAGPEAVVKIICELSKTVVKLNGRVRILEARIKELEDRLAKNSRNSSQPPSTDGYQKPEPRSLRQRTGRKPGGQKGHEGHTLEMVPDPDHVRVHKVQGRCSCGACLNDVAVTDYERRQVFDIPLCPVETTEHRAEIKTCPGCQRLHRGSFPESVQAPVQYGPRIKAMILYLRNYQLLPAARCVELFQHLFECPISAGTMDRVLAEGAARLKDCVAWIKEQITSSDTAHFDETGSSVKGDNHWLHAASTKQLTYYDIHVKRGTEAMDAIGILPEFRGNAIHDSWAPYAQYTQCWHSLCNAHHLRELTFVHEHLGQAWASHMIECLIKIKDKVDTAQANGLEQLTLRQQNYWRKHYRDIITEGHRANPWKDPPDGQRKRGRPPKGKARCLLERLDNHWSGVLGFMYDFRIPFDNNLSERDVRMMKLRQKISGTFRSPDMAQAFCRTRSFISTVRKQGIHIMDAIDLIFTGHPLQLFVQQ
jgi:transposase